MNDRKPQTQGSRLKELINSRGYTQEEFAKLIGVSKQMITHYINGRNKMSQKTLRRAVDVLNTSIDYLTLKSDDDIPERFSTGEKLMLSSNDERMRSRQMFRTAHAKEYLKAIGIRFNSIARIKGKEYICDDRGKWMTAYGDEIDFGLIIEEIRANHNDAEYFTEVAYKDKQIQMDEEQLTRFLISVYNNVVVLISSVFDVTTPIETEIAETFLMRALKGLSE